ncbi:MAG: MBL fold metallo-hydrolase [Oscillospiraceae bacterium]|nr:MBL fold metallo-hydrolase [Oscillospiraceae bacterium]
MRNTLLVFASAFFLFTGCKSNSPEIPYEDETGIKNGAINAERRTVTAEEAKRITDGGEPYVFLDVRTEDEYSELRIDGAVLLPHTNIAAEASEKLPDKEQIILVYCKTGIRSATAADELVKMGYTRVYDLGGIAGLPYDTAGDKITNKEEQVMATLLYQGHGSVRISTAEGKVIYVDPYAGEGYDIPADLILVTHGHDDHTQLSLIKTRNPGCEVITEKEAIKDGKHQEFNLGYVTVKAVEAGNKNHDPAICVGFILTFSDGVKLYLSGDTSETAQMKTFADLCFDYAFFCCDGIYNMSIEEASACAAAVKARHSIPYHMAPGKLFDRRCAEAFKAEGRIIVADGEEITLKH